MRMNMAAPARFGRTGLCERGRGAKGCSRAERYRANRFSGRGRVREESGSGRGEDQIR